MRLPEQPYVALYGSMSGDWRTSVASLLDGAGVPSFDPTDPRWSTVDDENGDAMQPLVDELVANEHRALRDAACAIFHLARQKTVRGRATGETTAALASRVELGLLLGWDLTAFVHVDADVVGRNYLWAACRASGARVQVCRTLDDAAHRAIAFMRKR